MRDLMRPEQLAEFFRRHHTAERLRAIVVEHAPDLQGRCPACHIATVGGCFLRQAAAAALQPRPAS